MHQLVYTSMATRMFSHADLIDLFDKSSSTNSASHITGMLLYDGRRFIQALEGSRTSVLDTMARILTDRRHSQISYLLDGPVPTRQFGDWTMDYRYPMFDMSACDFVERVKKAVSSVQDSAVQAAFIGFAALGRAHS